LKRYGNLWNNVARFKSSIITKDVEEGGIKLVNIKTYMDSLKLTWIRRNCNSDSKWQNHRSKLFNMEK